MEPKVNKETMQICIFSVVLVASQYSHGSSFKCLIYLLTHKFESIFMQVIQIALIYIIVQVA